MPEELEDFLTELPSDAAERILAYLDSNPDCVQEMITILAESHSDSLG